jgi:hypothetical protein
MSKMSDPKLAIIEIINRIIHVRKKDIVEDVSHLTHDDDVRVNIYNSHGYMKDCN